MTVSELDGRRLRRVQNREAVLNALLALFEEGDYAPNTAQIAERAGISPRSLFRYFDDVDDLNRAVVERELATARPLLDMPISPDASTADKILAVVEARLRLHEMTAPAARAARLAHDRPVITAQLHDGRAYLRRQLRTLFATELESRPDVLPAVDALLSFETHDLMRVAHGMSREKTATALVAALTALLVN